MEQPLGSADRLARWVSRFRWEQAPAAAVHAAKRSLLDVIGCALAGAAHPVAALARKYADEALASGRCAVVFGAPTGALAACQVNGTAAHAWDFDDTCYEGITHPSCVVWPAIQAAADLVQADGPTLLSAFIAGVEAECAVARGLGPEAYRRGWWNTGLLGVVGAAAGSARVLGLAEGTTSHALRLAATWAFGMRVFQGTPAKPFGAGQAARIGLEASLAARCDLTGPALAFEEHRGFSRLLSGQAFDQDGAATIGVRWGLVDPGIAYKMYPACSAMQAGVEAMLELRRQHALAAADIREVRCEVTPLVEVSLTFARPTTVAEAQFSLHFGIATALREGDFGIEHLHQGFINAAETRAVMAKVEMVRVEDLVASLQDELDCPEGARVIVRLNDGATLVRTLKAATGLPKRPAGDERLMYKFRRNASLVAPARAAEELASVIMSIETAPPGRLGAALTAASA